MALKRKINKDAFDALDDAQKAFYKQDGDNYLLDVDDEAFDALKEEKRKAQEAKDTLEAELAEMRRKSAAAEEKAREDAAKAAKAAGDVDALEKSWKEKHERDVAAARTDGQKATLALKNLFVNQVANNMANEISTVPDLLVDRIKARLDLEISDGMPITRVLTADGKPSALSLDDLKKEFVDNKSYAAIIKGSNAHGGGAGGGRDGDGVPNKKLSEMTATEEAKFANENPEAYARMVNGG